MDGGPTIPIDIACVTDPYVTHPNIFYIEQKVFSISVVNHIVYHHEDIRIWMGRANRKRPGRATLTARAYFR